MLFSLKNAALFYAEVWGEIAPIGPVIGARAGRSADSFRAERQSSHTISECGPRAHHIRSAPLP